MTDPTPTTNRSLPFRVDGFATLVDGLDYAARGETGFNFHSPRGELRTVLPYAELRDNARRLAERLPRTGLVRGDRIAIIAETGPDFVTAFFACQYAGLIPVPLPLAVNFGGREAYAERLHGMLTAADVRLAIASSELLPLLCEAATGTNVREVCTVGALMELPPVARPFAPFGADEPCYIQYSSGSTSFPRGVLVTQRAIAANAHAIAAHGLALRPDDRCVSWLPLYHDMGLVGCCLTPVMSQITVDYLETTAFARRPLVWLKLLSERRGTISFSPTFGYELAARRATSNNGVDRFDLGAWRVAGIGGEMIRESALRRFAETFAPARFDPRAFLASYGLAEATLAVTFAPLGEGVKVDRVARGETLERGRLAVPLNEEDSRPSRHFVLCGRPMPGYAVEVRDDDGRLLPERRIGRVRIKGPSLMSGYYRNPEASADMLTADGWLETGDMGYLVDGELVITGRSKDLIILGGRNIWPQDLEWAVEHIPGVRSGDVAAFSATDEEEGERVVVIVECRLTKAEDQERFRREIHAVLSRVAGVDCEVVLAPPRTLTYTTSGKLSRAAARAKYLAGQVRDVAETTGPELAPAA